MLEHPSAVLTHLSNMEIFMWLKFNARMFSGREFDRFGNLHQWWNNKTVNRFKKAADCMVKQYSNYTVKNFNINGKRTLGKPLFSDL